VEEFDHGAYLTQRLRRLEPESYEVEVTRARKRARIKGFFAGTFVSFVLVGAALVFLDYVPEALDAFVAALD
jgi:hypothetical protein